LEYKHRLSLEFTSNEDWDSLSKKLAELPSRIMDVEKSYFLIDNPVNGGLEVVGEWGSPDTDIETTWAPCIPCQVCDSNIKTNTTGINLHKFSGNSGSGIYCLEIINPFLPTGIIRFSLPKGTVMGKYQEEVFNSIEDEIVVALQTSQDRRRVSEMQSAEVAMAERRLVSSYVHDQLGQNLGYLHLKLDQLSTNRDIVKHKVIESEIKRLRDVANESYEIVRDILKKMQPETVPHLTNLMHEHAKSISKRAGFTLDFKSMGKPIGLLPNAQQIIFFTFWEMLGNVEKHARATRVEVLVIWNDGILDISVADNGKGFDAKEVRGGDHFGLGIMEERAGTLNGKITISSLPNSGTIVSLSIPLNKIGMVPA
jgi:signal transduction histidine kinase